MTRHITLVFHQLLRHPPYICSQICPDPLGRGLCNNCCTFWLQTYLSLEHIPSSVALCPPRLFINWPYDRISWRPPPFLSFASRRESCMVFWVPGTVAPHKLWYLNHARCRAHLSGTAMYVILTDPCRHSRMGLSFFFFFFFKVSGLINSSSRSPDQ